MARSASAPDAVVGERSFMPAACQTRDGQAHARPSTAT
jgi:hypothetical protein